MGLTRRFADTTALVGLTVAIVALMALSSVFWLEPILGSLQGPDPCGGAKGVRQPEAACVSAHPEYYQYDPRAGSLSTRAWGISQTVEAVVGPAALPLAAGGLLISWLALAVGTGLRRIALSALIFSALIVVLMGWWYFVLIFGGGD